MPSETSTSHLGLASSCLPSSPYVCPIHQFSIIPISFCPSSSNLFLFLITFCLYSSFSLSICDLTTLHLMTPFSRIFSRVVKFLSPLIGFFACCHLRTHPPSLQFALSAFFLSHRIFGFSLFCHLSFPLLRFQCHATTAAGDWRLAWGSKCAE